MATIDERIKAQEEKLKQLKAQKQKQEALKRAAEAKANRANDTRRKILIGAMMLEHMEKNEATKTSMMSKLDAFLIRKDDRELFGLSTGPSLLDLMKEASPELFEKKQPTKASDSE